MNPYMPRQGYPNNDRFIFPFLTGALIGGAAVGITRPRPIYNVAPVPYPPPPPPRVPYGPYGNYSYNYNYYYPYNYWKPVVFYKKINVNQLWIDAF